MLCTERWCPHTKKFICWNPTLGCDGIRMWGLWEVIRWWEWYPHEWRECLVRGRKDRSFQDFPGSSWLGLRTSSAGGTCSIPGQGTKIPQAVKNQNKQKERERKTEAFPLQCEDMERRQPSQKKEGECWPTGGRVIYQGPHNSGSKMLFSGTELKVRLTVWLD